MNRLQIAGFYVFGVARVGDKGRTGSHGADSLTDPLSTKDRLRQLVCDDLCHNRVRGKLRHGLLGRSIS